MPESFKTRLMRLRFNLFPAYRRTGARVTYISDDFFEIKIKLSLNWKTKNYVGTTFGGSIYGAVDPMFMMILIHQLGSDYIVWDKGATIRFKKPGRSTLFATFKLDQNEIDTIKQELTSQQKIDRLYHVNLVDSEGVVHAEVDKVVHVRLK